MHTLLKRVLVLCALVCFVAPPSALAGGGPCGGGGGGARTELVAVLQAPTGGPILGNITYRADGTRQTLTATVSGLLPFAGTTVELTLGGVLQNSTVVSSSGTFAYSADRQAGATIASIALNTVVAVAAQDGTVIARAIFL
jgi:hypothetical protein